MLTSANLALYRLPANNEPLHQQVPKRVHDAHLSDCNQVSILTLRDSVFTVQLSLLRAVPNSATHLSGTKS